MFRWWPIYHDPSETTLYYAGYQDASCPLWLNASTPDWDPTPTAARMSASTCDKWRDILWLQANPVYWGFHPLTASEITVTPYEVLLAGGQQGDEPHGRFSWKAVWTPIKHVLDSSGGITIGGETATATIDYYQSPVLYAVQCRATPYMLDKAAWPGTTDITGYVQACAIQAGEGSRVTQCGLQLKNTDATTLGITDYQMITVELGYVWDDARDDLTDKLVFVGYVVSPGRGAQVGPLENCDLVAYDPLIRLRDEKVDGFVPDCQLFTPKGAIGWLAARAGFDATQQSLAGSDVAMYLGDEGYDGEPTNGASDPGNDALMPAFATELAAAVAEFARRDNESLVHCTYDPTNLFVLTKTNGQPGASTGSLFTIYEDAAAAEYHLYAIDTQDVPMDAGEYADTVVVRGEATDGEPVQAVMWDAERVTDPADGNWGGGWRHIYAETRKHIQTTAAAQAKANDILTKRRKRPRIITVETDVIYNLTRADRIVVSLHTGSTGKAYQAGALDVECVVLDWTDTYGRNKLPRMRIRARTLT